MYFEMRRLIAILGLAVPAFAQYAGPAILSRGEAPTAMAADQIDFRPYLTITGVYDTGLAGVSVNSQGEIGNASSYGLEFAGGISGVHSWKHTKIGLDYHGDVHHYFSTTYYDNTDQTLLLGITHQFTRHVTLLLNEGAGIFSLDYGALGLPASIPFDPSTLSIPVTDFFDNRTVYASTQANLIYQRTARLSFSFGGGGYLNRRRSTALYGVTGASAQADVEYRLTRNTTIGALYTYNHYSFTRILSDADMHGGAGTFAHRFTQTLELTLYGGFFRLETEGVQDVSIDPAIAALLGISSTQLSVNYSVHYVPNASGRLSQTFKKGVMYLAGGRTVTPGNGLFLTSEMTNITAGYTYTGIRRWSFNALAARNNGRSVGNIINGDYRDTTGTVSISRDLTRAVHVVAGGSVHQYGSNDFAQYNRRIYDVRIGLQFAPGNVPLHIF
ncbi:MAG: hypothetical protein ACLQVN_16335 [Bryobacteraceae bacterium]